MIPRTIPAVTDDASHHLLRMLVLLVGIIGGYGTNERPYCSAGSTTNHTTKKTAPYNACNNLGIGVCFPS